MRQPTFRIPALCVALALLGASVPPARAGDLNLKLTGRVSGDLNGNVSGDIDAGIELRDDASLAEIGLPLFPGAAPWRDAGEDSAGATIGLWGGSLGFRLRAMKFASAGGVDEVAAFYRRALGRYGAVLDCSLAAEPGASDSQKLRCDHDAPKAGGRLYKVGRPGDYRLVSVEPVTGGVRFALLRIEAHSD